MYSEWKKETSLVPALIFLVTVHLQAYKKHLDILGFIREIFKKCELETFQDIPHRKKKSNASTNTEILNNFTVNKLFLELKCVKCQLQIMKSKLN